MNDEDVRRGAPDWMVTFGDMMALLLTFFIMLVSFGEPSSEEKYQALVDSFQEQFGYPDAEVVLKPGQVRARNSALSKMATSGRVRRQDVLRKASKVQAQPADRAAKTPSSGETATRVGTVLYFQQEQYDLDANQQFELRRLAESLRGESGAVEVRGQVAESSDGTSEAGHDELALSFQRSRRVMEFLVDEGLIESHRLRISVASYEATQHESRTLQRRVDVVMDEGSNPDQTDARVNLAARPRSDSRRDVK